jgi:hypothetical protein
MTDDLTDEVDLLIGASRMTWKVAGPFTFLLTFIALVMAVIEVMSQDVWILKAMLTVLVGFVFGWLTDLFTLLIMRPLAKLVGIKPSTWIGDLLLGIPIALLILFMLVYLGWV